MFLQLLPLQVFTGRGSHIYLILELKVAPDVYDDTPTIVTIWLTVMPKISILIFLLELHTQLGVIVNNININLFSSGLVEVLNNITYLTGNKNYTNFLSENIINVLTNLLLISSLLSLIIGTIVGLAQSRIKRLLA